MNHCIATRATLPPDIDSVPALNPEPKLSPAALDRRYIHQMCDFIRGSYNIIGGGSGPGEVFTDRDGVRQYTKAPNGAIIRLN